MSNPLPPLDLRDPFTLLLWLNERAGQDIIDARNRREGLARLLGDLDIPADDSGPDCSPFFPGAEEVE